jgi:hypothetical protein
MKGNDQEKYKALITGTVALPPHPLNPSLLPTPNSALRRKMIRKTCKKD